MIRRVGNGEWGYFNRGHLTLLDLFVRCGGRATIVSVIMERVQSRLLRWFCATLRAAVRRHAVNGVGLF